MRRMALELDSTAWHKSLTFNYNTFYHFLVILNRLPKDSPLLLFHLPGVECQKPRMADETVNKLNLDGLLYVERASVIMSPKTRYSGKVS